MSEHDQFRELIEAYALGALDANERAALEAHLASGCPECAKSLEEARLVVTQLAYLAPPAPVHFFTGAVKASSSLSCAVPRCPPARCAYLFTITSVE